MRMLRMICNECMCVLKNFISCRISRNFTWVATRHSSVRYERDRDRAPCGRAPRLWQWHYQSEPRPAGPRPGETFGRCAYNPHPGPGLGASWPLAPQKSGRVSCSCELAIHIYTDPAPPAAHHLGFPMAQPHRDFFAEVQVLLLVRVFTWQPWMNGLYYVLS